MERRLGKFKNGWENLLLITVRGCHCQEINLFVSLFGQECSLLRSGEDVKVRCFLFRPRCIVPYE